MICYQMLFQTWRVSEILPADWTENFSILSDVLDGLAVKSLMHIALVAIQDELLTEGLGTVRALQTYWRLNYETFLLSLVILVSRLLIIQINLFFFLRIRGGKRFWLGWSVDVWTMDGHLRLLWHYNIWRGAEAEWHLSGLLRKTMWGFHLKSMLFSEIYIINT